MNNKIALILTALVIAAIVGLHCSGSSDIQRLQRQSNFEVVYKSISSVLRVPFTAIYAKGDMVVAGDSVAGVNVWNYNQKKGKLEFGDTSRSVEPVLPTQNKVIAIDSLPEGIVALTQDGKLTTYPTNSASKITGKIAFNNSDTFSEFRIIKSGNSTFLATICKQKKYVCLYKTEESIIRPGKLTEVGCNSSNLTLSGLSYDPVNQLIAVGDHSRAIFYQLNFTEGAKAFAYSCEANLPKAEELGFDSQFKNGTLLAVNDLWVNSIVINLTNPSAKVLSSSRTENLVKSGKTTTIAVNLDEKSKETVVLVNAKNLIKGYEFEKNLKVAFKNQSNNIGRIENFVLSDASTMFTFQDISVYAYTVGDETKRDYTAYSDDQPIESNNHFKQVNNIVTWNDTVVSVSDGAPSNLMLWKIKDFQLTFVDKKTLSYFSLLKTGYTDLFNALIIPPQSKISAHIVTAGTDPFSLIIIPITSQGKLGGATKSKDSHYSNITALFLTADSKQIITASMDSLIKVWGVAANHDAVDDNTTTIQTKYGGIRLGLQDKTGQYYVFGHCNTNTSALVNITVWTLDSKKGMVKVTENTPSEAHESNLTHLLFSKDEKYIISLSESGQLRLWQHKNFTMVDLLASLSIGILQVSLEVTDSNKLILQSDKQFTEYSFDFNGFILQGRRPKQYLTPSQTMKIMGSTLLSGDSDGSIRIYEHSD